MTARSIVRLCFLGGLGVLAAVPPAAAQTALNVKLGLWEVTSTIQHSGTPPVDISRVPPAQRAQVEAMMKSQMAQATAPTTRKQCVTKEDIDRAFMNEHRDESCTRTIVQSTSTVLALRMTCTGATKMNGDVRFDAITPEAVKGVMKFDMEGEGHTMTVNSTVAAKWISSSCAGVK